MSSTDKFVFMGNLSKLSGNTENNKKASASETWEKHVVALSELFYIF